MLCLIRGEQITCTDGGYHCGDDGTSVWLVEGEQEAKKSAQDWWDKKLAPKDNKMDEVYFSIRVYHAVDGLSFDHDGSTKEKPIFELESDRMNST